MARHGGKRERDKMRRWTEEETDRALAMQANGADFHAIGAALGRTFDSVQGRIEYLALTPQQRERKREGTRRRRAGDEVERAPRQKAARPVTLAGVPHDASNANPVLRELRRKLSLEQPLNAHGSPKQTGVRENKITLAGPAAQPVSDTDPVVGPVPFSEQTDNTGGVDIMGLTDKTCRWPLWGHDPDAHPKLFCGDPVTRRSYCAHHARIAYQPTPQRINIEPRPKDGRASNGAHFRRKAA